MIAMLSALLAAAQPAVPMPAPCTEAESVSTTVEAIADDPDGFLDRCVTVSGPLAGRRLYSGRDGIYLASRFGPDGNFSPASRRHSIGVDFREAAPLSAGGLQVATLTGRVDSCARRAAAARERERADGTIIMLGGFCHYSDGLTLVVDRAVAGGERLERLTGERARARFGDLAFMPQDWPTRAALDSLVAEFLAALRAGDRAKLFELHEFRDEGNRHHQAVLDTLLSEADSPWSELRAGGPIQTAYFLLADEDGVPFGRDRPGPAATVCFCRTDDCADRWPISLNDTAGAPDHPYACTQVETRGHPPRKPVVNTLVGGDWLAEPAATRFARGGP